MSSNKTEADEAPEPKLVAETEIGDYINGISIASCLAHGAVRLVRVASDYAANGPNVGREMWFQYVPEWGMYQRIPPPDQRVSQPVERCKLCGHVDGIGDASGLCAVQVPICSDDYHGTQPCGCRCVFTSETESETGNESDLQCAIDRWCHNP